LKASKTAIKVKNVSKTFYVPTEKKGSIKSYFLNPFHKAQKCKFNALKNISFEVKKGDFFGIIGRNGSGKSTLLKLIASIYMPDKGKITVNGKIVPFLELGVGFNPELSGRENIFLNGTILGMKREYLEKKFDEIVDFAEVRKFIDMPLKNYSSGMQVRLAFSIAIQANADIYLLDEVLAVGDADFQEKCINVFNKLKKQNKTVVFVTHDLNSVEKFCTNTILLDNGKIVDHGNPKKVIYSYLNENNNTENNSQSAISSDRWGNRIVEITSVRFKDKDNNVKKAFNTGEDFTIEIKYNSKKKVRKPNFGIAIFDHKDNYCYGINSKIDNVSPNFISGKGKIHLIYPKIKLLQGTYYIDVAIYGKTEKEIYDFHNKKYKFRIIDNVDAQGTVILDHKWKLNE